MENITDVTKDESFQKLSLEDYEKIKKDLLAEIKAFQVSLNTMDKVINQMQAKISVHDSNIQEKRHIIFFIENARNTICEELNFSERDILRTPIYYGKLKYLPEIAENIRLLENELTIAKDQLTNFRDELTTYEGNISRLSADKSCLRSMVPHLVHEIDVNINTIKSLEESFADPSSDESEEKEKQLKQLQEEITTKTDQLENLKKILTDTLNMIETKSLSVNQLIGICLQICIKINVISVHIKVLENKITEVKEKYETLQKELENKGWYPPELMSETKINILIESTFIIEKYNNEIFFNKHEMQKIQKLRDKDKAKLDLKIKSRIKLQREFDEKLSSLKEVKSCIKKLK